MSWSKRRIVLTLTIAAVAFAAAGAIALSASLGDSESVDRVSTARLGSSFQVLDHIESLPAASSSAGAVIAANPRLGMPDADVGPARILASHGSASLLLITDSENSNRLCLMSTGLRFEVTCTDREQLGNGRAVVSVPLVRETAQTITTTPRVDFVVVPDEVESVTTADGPATITDNVAVAERPHGGPMGTVEYVLKDGRRLSVAFATASP